MKKIDYNKRALYSLILSPIKFKKGNIKMQSIEKDKIS